MYPNILQQREHVCTYNICNTYHITIIVPQLCYGYKYVVYMYKGACTSVC